MFVTAWPFNLMTRLIKLMPEPIKLMPRTVKLILGTVKLILGTSKLIPATSKLIPATIKLILGTIKLILGTSKLILGTIKLIPGTVKMMLGTVKLISGSWLQLESPFQTYTNTHSAKISLNVNVAAGPFTTHYDDVYLCRIGNAQNVAESSPAPRIEQRHSGQTNIRRIPRDERQAVMERRRGELRIDRGQRNALPSGERLDLTPAFRDPLIERKEPACKADAQVVIEPALERSSLRLIFIEQVDPFSNLSNGDDTEMHQFLRRCDDPRGNRARGLWLHQLGDDVRIEQIAGGDGYHLMVLVESRFRLRSSV